MLADTHRAWAAAWWLGVTLAVDAAAAWAGSSAPVGPAAVAAGVIVAPLFSAGRGLPPRRVDRYGRPRGRDWTQLGVSPDIDHRWAPGPPRRSYDWRGHRGWTHRPWFAAVVTVVSGVLPWLIAVAGGASPATAAVLFAPAAGWWSHLSGDMIYGRLPVWLPSVERVAGATVLVPDGVGRMVRVAEWRWRVGWRRRIVGLGWSTGGVLERGGRWWRDPAAWVCTAGSVVLAAGHLALLAGTSSMY